MGLADGECLVGGFDDAEAFFHRRARSELVFFEVARIETRPTGQERPPGITSNTVIPATDPETTAVIAIAGTPVS